MKAHRGRTSRASRASAAAWPVVALVVLAVLAPAACARPLADVHVVGHESLSTRDVESIVRALADSLNERDLSAAADSLLSTLTRLGRPFARVRMDWDDDVEDGILTVSIDEGVRLRVGSTEVAGGSPGTLPEVSAPGAISAGSPVTGAGVASDAEALLSSLENSGRPLASVVPWVADYDGGGTISLAYEVVPGPEVRFGRLLVSGNDVTRPYVVERESGIRSGEPYSASRVDRIRPRLERTGLFSSVEEPLVVFDRSTGTAAVRVKVREAPAGRISGVLGYAPPAAGEDSGTLTGLVSVSLGNIAGTGRSAAAEWRRVTRDETRISFEYNEPWVLGGPVDVGVAGTQTVGDTTYTATEGDLLVSARAGERARLTWSVGAKRYVPVGTGETTTTTYRTGVEGTYDGTDAPANPTSGVSARLKLGYAAREGGDSGGDVRTATLSAESWGHLGVRAGQVLSLGLSAGGIYSTDEDVPFHELLTLGGASDLRGYREEQFRGTRKALATLEYRLLLGRRSRAVAFVDAGYVYRPSPNFAKDTKLGYGIGLRGETRLGIISMDYGLGEGDALLDGKLHIGLIRDF